MEEIEDSFDVLEGLCRKIEKAKGDENEVKRLRKKAEANIQGLERMIGPDE